MSDILLKSASFIILILLAYLLKRRGLFAEGDYRILVKIIMNVTLPAAVITGFTGVTISWSMLAMVLIGLGANVLLLALGWLATRGKPAATRALAMLSLPGYNIGAFAIPYLQAFIGPAGVITACMFDAGNALVCTGGGYAVTSAAVASGKNKPSLRFLAKRLFSSVTFDVYLAMLAITLLGLQIPEWLLKLIAPAGAANAGIAMFMIGLMFRWDSKPGYLRSALAIVAVRNLFGIAASCVIWFCTPLAIATKQVLIILLFAPIAVMSTAFTEKCGGDPGLAGFVNSLSILVSVLVITCMVVLGGIGG